MPEMGHELPDGFTWSKSFVIKCERCKKELDCRPTPPERYVVAHERFVEDHTACLEDPGLKPASSLTIRDELASRALAAIIGDRGSALALDGATIDRDPNQNHTDACEAVRIADELLRVLYPPKAPSRSAAIQARRPRPRLGA